MAAAERARPGAAAATAEDNGKAPKAKAKYHLYQRQDDDSLAPYLGQFEGRFAEQAVGAFIDTPGEHAELAEKVGKGEATIAVVPDRNLTVVTATVETKTKVKLTAV